MRISDWSSDVCSSDLRIGILTVSDRASRGEYEDISGPAIESWLGRAITSTWAPLRRIVPDGLEPVRKALIAFCDAERSEERRVGKGGVRTSSSRWSPTH